MLTTINNGAFVFLISIIYSLIEIEMEGILFQPIPLETATLTINVGQVESSIPDWIKNNAGWWADGQIDDNSFVSGLQWLISNGIMKIS